ncbi:hypothetical protein B0T24DRAFT_725286 [Lasiosphaeria ovina]|uniref:Uncharacterized protein n=1 Tax=Lasiosphaeria ovina TaxID=92902 RepID=A0AAE0JS50_9PEZI|nr:hypothetical protein B0T24DRAFT_725286 [Lasiosphaeria ovina]
MRKWHLRYCRLLSTSREHTTQLATTAAAAEVWRKHQQVRPCLYPSNLTAGKKIPRPVGALHNRVHCRVPPGHGRSTYHRLPPPKKPEQLPSKERSMESSKQANTHPREVNTPRQVARRGHTKSKRAVLEAASSSLGPVRVYASSPINRSPEPNVCSARAILALRPSAPRPPQAKRADSTSAKIISTSWARRTTTRRGASRVGRLRQNRTTRAGKSTSGSDSPTMWWPHYVNAGHVRHRYEHAEPRHAQRVLSTDNTRLTLLRPNTSALGQTRFIRLS